LETIHYVVKEAIRQNFLDGLKKVLITTHLDKTTEEVLTSYIDTYYHPSATADGYIQFYLSGASDPDLRYTFQALSNHLKIQPEGKKPRVMCHLPPIFTDMVRTILMSTCLGKEKPKDHFFESARKLLPETVVQGFDKYLLTPRKERKFQC
jgi:hypothetical protein